MSSLKVRRSINQRDLEITKLAESVEEVAQLFRDLHLLTLDQGKTIDTIDTNLESTSHNVESGIGQIREANNLQKKGRPIRCCILLVVVIMILIAVILVSVLTRTS
jgi:t-SNARE complex subunit (syntaxin)